MLNWLAINWLNLLVASGLAGIIATILNYRFSKRINEHVEKLKFALQTEIINAQHIIPQRNNAYKELSNLVEYAYASTGSQIMSLGTPPPLEKAMEDVTKMNNFLVEHSVFMSANVTEKLFALHRDMRKMLLLLSMDHEDRGKCHAENTAKLYEAVKTQVKEVRTLLNQELWEGLRIKNIK